MTASLKSAEEHVIILAEELAQGVRAHYAGLRRDATYHLEAAGALTHQLLTAIRDAR